MRKHLFFFLLSAFAFLSGCGKQEKIPDFAENEINMAEYAQTGDLSDNMEIVFYDLPCPENAVIGAWCVYNDLIFYAVDYIDHLSDHTGTGAAPAPSDVYNTRILRYDISTESAADFYVAESMLPISDLCCNGEILLWEEYPENIEISWELKYKLLDDPSMEPNILLKDGDVDGELWDIIPNLDGNKVYLYEQTSADDTAHPVLLYCYDIISKKASLQKTDLDLSSPYEQVSILDQWMASYQINTDNSSIYLENIENGEEKAIQVPTRVCHPVANGSYCIWKKTYDAELTPGYYLYNDSRKSIDYIQVENNIFAYTILGDYVILTCSDGIWCYDPEKRQYQCLLDDEDYSYIYISTGDDGNAYTAVETFQDGGIRIARIQLTNKQAMQCHDLH